MTGPWKTFLLAAALGLFLTGGVQADPPSLIRVIRNAGSIQPYADANAGIIVIGAAPVSGFAETWLTELHDSFASVEAVDQSLASAGASRNQGGAVGPDDLLLPLSRTVIGVYRPGLSYRPNEAEKLLARARYLMVAIYRIRLGSEAQFADLIHLRGARFDSVNLDRPDIAYEVVSGASAGTYLFITPLTTLKALDEGYARTPNYAEGARDSTRKAMADADVRLERLLLRVDPRMSWVSEEFAAADTEFWTAKPKQQ